MFAFLIVNLSFVAHNKLMILSLQTINYSDLHFFITDIYLQNEKKKGLSTSEIARQNGINWRTAKKYSESISKPKYVREQRKSKIDDYKSMIDSLLE